MTSPPPVIVLSGHRTGSSAVAGLLHLSGLEMGDLLPPSHDNPRGYFESRHVLDASRKMLAGRTRDWTCPPQHFEPQPTDIELVTAVLDDLADPKRRWGFKDPRTLFLLPAWLEVLPEVILIGVSRSVAATAKSINARDRIPFDEATKIAEAYDRRLVGLQRAIGFPVIDFGADMNGVLESAKELVDQIDGLTWNSEGAADFLDLSLVHHTDASPADRAVRADLSPIRAAIVMRALNSLDKEAVEPGRVHGPAYRGRLDADWRRATALRPEIGAVIDLVAAPRLQPPIYGAAETIQLTISDLLDGEPADRVSHIVATDILEQVGPDQLPELLSAMATATDADGVAVVSGYVVDSQRVPESRFFPEADVATHQAAAPYFHHRSLIEAALLRTSWYLGQVRETPGGRTQLILVKSAERRSPNFFTANELRTVVKPRLDEKASELESENRALEAENRRLSADVTRRDEGIKRLRADFDMERAEARTRTQLIRDELERRRRADEANANKLNQTQERLGRVAAERDQALARNKSLTKQSASMLKQRDAARRDLNKLRSRRSVRIALGFAGLFRPLFRFVRRPREKTGSDGSGPRTTGKHPSSKDSSAVAAAIRQLRHEPGPDIGTLVSIIVTTRNGLHHLEQLIPGLESNTRYRSFELIVVDNGSTDGTREYLTKPRSFPIRVIRNEANRSFSAANNQGIRAATGDLILLLNNDIEPISPGWLGAMVTEVEQSETTGAVGALLVYSDRPESEGEINYPGLTIQHRGIAFGWKNNHPWARNLGGGEDPTDRSLTGSWKVPAATAACLMVRSSTLHEVGLLDEAYTYGSEDVDLCLKIRQAGAEIRLCGDAALFHHEFGTQDEMAREVKRINRTGNERHFVENWSPQLRRSIQSDALAGGGIWDEADSPSVAITLTQDDPAAGWGDWYTAHELGDAFEDAGWRVVYAERFKDRWNDLPEDIDVVVSLLDAFDVRRAPRGAITVAWIRNWLDRWIDRPWLEHFDEVAVSSSPAAAEIATRTRFRPYLVPIATNPTRFSPGESEPTFESDYTFTGNFWGEGRSLIDKLLLRPDEDFLLFGKGWDKVPRAQRYWRGQLDYERLPAVYRSTKIVLDDTASPTLPYGFLNSRVFDALATGTLVITDNKAGSQDLFDGALPAYESRHELRDLMDRFVGDDAARHDLADQLRETVTEKHTYQHRAADFAAIAAESIGKPRIAFKIGPPTWEEAPAWGDTHFARQFAATLGRRGLATELHVLEEWDDPSKQDVDVVVHLRGLTPYVPKPAHYNVLWIISHPDDVSLEECARYDLVLVASKPFADELADKVDVPVVTMLQATDTHLFTPEDMDVPETAPVRFVGNSRGEYRKAVRWAGEQKIPIEIYGGDWDELLGAGVSHGSVPNDELPALYQSAAILLNDHWDDMAARGFVSNRVFDALACGAFVVSDYVDGMEDLLGDIVPTYRSAEELAEIIEQYSANPRRRNDLIRRGIELVRSQHSFEARAEQFLGIIETPLRQRRAGVGPDTGHLEIGEPAGSEA